MLSFGRCEADERIVSLIAWQPFNEGSIPCDSFHTLGIGLYNALLTLAVVATKDFIYVDVTIVGLEHEEILTGLSVPRGRSPAIGATVSD